MTVPLFEIVVDKVISSPDPPSVPRFADVCMGVVKLELVQSVLTLSRLEIEAELFATGRTVAP